MNVLPKGFEVDLEPYCAGCESFEVARVSAMNYADNKAYMVGHRIICKHHKLCSKIFTHMDETFSSHMPSILYPGPIQTCPECHTKQLLRLDAYSDKQGDLVWQWDFHCTECGYTDSQKRVVEFEEFKEAYNNERND